MAKTRIDRLLVDRGVVSSRERARAVIMAGKVLVGEVSKVNDDVNDNRFLKPTGRFPEIEEDEPPLHLLVGDYAKYYQL